NRSARRPTAPRPPRRRHRPRCRRIAGSPAPPPQPPEPPSRLLLRALGARPWAVHGARGRRRSSGPAGRTISRLEVVQPAGLFDVTAREDLADLLGNLVLVVSHVDAVVVSQVEDLDLSGVVRHDVFEGLLDPAQPLIDAPDDLDSTPKRNLE